MVHISMKGVLALQMFDLGYYFIEHSEENTNDMKFCYQSFSHKRNMDG